MPYVSPLPRPGPVHSNHLPQRTSTALSLPTKENHVNERLEAAAKAINQRAVKPVEWDAPNLGAYRFNRIYDARIILGAADEVMFSEGNLERAETAVSVMRDGGYVLSRDLVQAVVAELKGEV